LLLRNPRLSLRTAAVRDWADVQFLFDDHVLDVERRELRRAGRLIAMEPQVFDLLVHLVRNRERVVSKDDLIEAVWHGRVVSESTLTSRINAVRKAVGDSGEAQRLIRTVQRKGIRFVGAVSEAIAPCEAGGAAKAEPSRVPALRHEIHFCTASDGVRIAYAEVGTGPPLVKAANWLNHLEYDWESPIWSPLLHELAAAHRLIRYDARGNGLSDWEVDDISFEAFVRDLESVVEATGIQRFALLGISQGCAVSIAYAVRHPERVSHLVLYGGFARGKRKRGSPQDIEQADAVLTLIRQGWGQENPAFRQIFTSLFIPGATAEQVQWFNELQQRTTSPENAARIRRAVDDIDVTDLLARVAVPTLVLHCRSDAGQPFEEGRTLAAGIRGARFVALEGHNHVILEGDPGWRRFLDEVKSFLQR
jgi:pimeloyl-ACP methyl ester carboxylesterase/DNA-binding winged helix-turn-helix (wHTH) protein